MNVLYTCDDNYVWLMGVSIISLLENNKKLENISIFILGDNISEYNKEKLKDISLKYNRSITVINMPKIEIPESLLKSRWPRSAFYRLYSAQYLPKNIKKVLYLDCDTIVTGDLSKLDEIDIKESLFCGVLDCVGKYYKKNIGLSKDSIYINAGVLLINIDDLRKINIFEELKKYLNKYQKYINYADQDILNGVFHKKIKPIKCNYNVMTIFFTRSYEEIKKLRNPTCFYEENELLNAIEFPLIIHFTTNMRIVRPWFSNSNHPMKQEFLKYFSISPWSDKHFNEFSKKSKLDSLLIVLDYFPKTISYPFLGLLHSMIRPFFMNLKGKISIKRQ